MPSGGELAEWMSGLSLAAGVDFSGVPDERRSDPLWISHTIVEHDSALRAPLHEEVARHLRALEADAEPSPELRLLAGTPNKAALVLTLNYDRLLERAAEQIGRAVQPLTVRDIPALTRDGLRDPGETLRVLHLHGILAGESEGLVLDPESYADRANDPQVRDLLSTLTAFYNLCILGSSFEEQYLANALMALRPATPRHVIVCSATVASRIRGGESQLKPMHRALICDYAAGEHDVLRAFCERLVRPEEPVPASGPRIRIEEPDEDPLYQRRQLRLVVASTDDAATVTAAFDDDHLLDEQSLRVEQRGVLVGAPGTGKSELLKRLAIRPFAGERAVLLRLRNVSSTIGDPRSLLAAWVDAGQVIDGGEPFSAAAIAAGTIRVHLLLDGLDELPQGLRTDVARAIVRIGDALPEQRLTVSSRPVAALDVFSERWQRFELVCDVAWRQGLLARAGVSIGEISRELGPVYEQIEPLMSIPFFLRGMLALHKSGSQPKDGLDLVLKLLRERQATDQELQAIGQSLDAWLSRVALTMALSGSSALSIEQLRVLASDTALGDPDAVAGLLAGRSLLLESAGSYSFQHRIFGEALVAEYLEGQPANEWLDVLVPSDGGRATLREDWAGIAGLLLPRSTSWRAAVRTRDPRAAARATPATATLFERDIAARYLWTRAQDLDVWIDDGAAPNDRSDCDVVGDLIRAGDLEALADGVRSATNADSRFRRGNAVDVIASAQLPDAEALLRRVLRDDDDSVVRRNGASAAETLGLSSLAGVLERRATHPDDGMEASDATSALFALTPPAERLALGHRLLAAGSHEVHPWYVLDGLPPAEKIRWLAERAMIRGSRHGQSADARAEDYGEDWWIAEHFDSLIAELRSVGDREAAHVGVVAASIKSCSDVVLGFLRDHRSAAVGLLDAIEAELVQPYEVAEQLAAIGRTALVHRGASSAVVEVGERAEHREGARREPLIPVQRQYGPRRPSGLDEAMQIPDADQRLEALQRFGSRVEQQVASASLSTRRLLVEFLDDLWGQQDLRESVDVVGDRATVSVWASTVLIFGPEIGMPLASDRWQQVALCGWLFAPQRRWLRETAAPDAVSRAVEGVVRPIDVGHLAEVAGADELRLLVKVVEQREVGWLDARSIERFVNALTIQAEPEFLRRLAGHDPAIAAVAGPQLAAAGDLLAQQKQLAELKPLLAAGTSPGREAGRWLSAVSDGSLFLQLIACYELAAVRRRGDESPLDDLTGPLQTAIEQADPIRAVTYFDEVVARPPWYGAQFLIDRRDAVLQRLLLPRSQAAAVRVAQALGLPVVGPGGCQEEPTG